WIIDPLDGTTNYLYGIPAFCVSIAAEQDGELVAAAVFDPVHDELFTAALGDGAYRNDERMTVQGPPSLDLALIGTGFSYQAGLRSEQGGLLETVLSSVRDIRRSGSAALDLCAVACGRLDGF